MSDSLPSGQILAMHQRSIVRFNDYSGGIAGFIPQEERVSEPTLNPMPGKVIVKLVDRMTRFPDYSKWAKLVHRSDLQKGEMDQNRQYQPYLGMIVAFGRALDDEDQLLIDDAKERTANGEKFIFSWGNGIDYSTEEMMMLETPAGKKRFEWLALLRVFRIKDLACSVAGGDEFGGDYDVQ